MGFFGPYEGLFWPFWCQIWPILYVESHSKSLFLLNFMCGSKIGGEGQVLNFLIFLPIFGYFPKKSRFPRFGSKSTNNGIFSTEKIWMFIIWGRILKNSSFRTLWRHFLAILTSYLANFVNRVAFKISFFTEFHVGRPN